MPITPTSFRDTLNLSVGHTRASGVVYLTVALLAEQHSLRNFSLQLLQGVLGLVHHLGNAFHLVIGIQVVEVKALYTPTS